MHRTMSVIVALSVLAGCGAAPPSPAGKTAGTKPVLVLPSDPLEMTLVQRTGKAIPGSENTLTLAIGDISGGQTAATLTKAGEKEPVATLSMREGDVIPFDAGNARYYIRLRKLKNVVAGDDYAMFVVSETDQRGMQQASEAPLTTRPATWAQPIELAGAPNLHKISDTVYRSAQPTAEGMRNLKKLGITSVVNLRSFHSDRDEIGETGLAYEHIYMKAWNAEDEELVRFLQIVTDPKRTPVLFHCQHGADRTGTMCAVYRIAVQGWTKEEAIKEMTRGGFGYHTVWANLLRYLEKLDVAAIKKRAGL